MMKRFLLSFIIFVYAYNLSTASGVILPTNDNYIKDLLRNKSIEVTVNINGNLAETIVYEEFLNEGAEITDGVYSFPLPEYARCLGVYYWRNDTLFQAKLQVEPQETNPGTGEGGIAAVVNDYIGKNGLRIKLLDIQPGGIQKIEIHYLETLNYYNGKYSYKFPLNTSALIGHQLDYLDININIESGQEIIDYSSDSHDPLKIVDQTSNSVKIRYNKSKVYLANDFNFQYTVANSQLSLQFLSNKLSDLGGHFAFFYNTENITDISKKIDSRIIFVLEASSNMFGGKLNQSIDAIKESVHLLSADDKFNIIVYSGAASGWKSEPQSADPANIESAKLFLDEISVGGSSNMNSGLELALNQINDTSFNNSILLFTTGVYSDDLFEIENMNEHQTGIFAVGAGSNAYRAPLEILAERNNGLTYYFTENDYNKNDILKFVQKVANPIARNVRLSFEKEDIHNFLPITSPSLFAGSSFFGTGKYENADDNFFAILASARDSQYVRVFQVEFTNDSTDDSFADKLWAKSNIDRLEWDIELFGETPEKKDSLIDLSLAYNIRCRYTSYIADYADDSVVDMKEIFLLPKDYSTILNNFPNPFNPSTTFRFYIAQKDLGKNKFIKIYNVLGQLVALIDITGYSSGWHEITFNGKDFSGGSLPSGTYFARFQIGNSIVKTLKISMVK